MRYTKKCENCIWFGKCNSAEACDDYYPTGDDTMDVAFYEQDLKERHEEYMELIDEQNA